MDLWGHFQQLWLLCLSLLQIQFLSHGFGIRDSLVKRFVILTQPEQIHIAFGGTAQDIVILWATRKEARFVVEIIKEANEIKKVEAENSLLEIENKKGAKYLYRALLSNLTPGGNYAYRIVGNSSTASSVFKFRVPTTTPKRIHTFMVVADMGLRSKDLKFLVYEAWWEKYEAVFHVGDIAYDLHRDKGFSGDQFLKKIEKSAAQVPYMTVPGDHERFYNFTHYRYRFSMPKSMWPMLEDQLWYSLDIGPVHFVAINTEVFYTLLAQQTLMLRWLKRDLQNANKDRDQHPWIIVLGHRPMYCSPTTVTSSPCDCDCVSETASPIRSQLEDLFFEAGVDMYISGHRHNYERSWPMYRGKVFQQSYFNPKAPIHLVNGAMGYEYLTETFAKPFPWSAQRLSDKRKELYGKLQVLNGSHLMWDVYAAANNEHEDSILVIQWRHGPFGKAGNEAFESAIKLHHLPPAPFVWQPPPRHSWFVQMFYDLPSDTRKAYMLTLCCTMLVIVLCIVSMPRFRKKMFRL